MIAESFNDDQGDVQIALDNDDPNMYNWNGPCVENQEDPGFEQSDLESFGDHSGNYPDLQIKTDLKCGPMIACPIDTNEMYFSIVENQGQTTISNWYLVVYDDGTATIQNYGLD